MVIISDGNLANELIWAGNSYYETNKKEAIHLLSLLINQEGNRLKLVAQIEQQKKNFDEFNAVVLNFKKLYLNKEIGGAKNINQVEKIKKITEDLKFSDDDNINIYAENLRREILTLHFLAITKEKD